ncbi:MAG: hypothetical protein CSB33_02540 [Desulfobacterales bacterium]|nr:MAG: hypothetical protein CSB33_02540 [Desulfobacterales bacterium]
MHGIGTAKDSQMTSPDLPAPPHAATAYAPIRNQRRPPALRLVLQLVLAGILLLALQACGGGDGDAPAGGVSPYPDVKILSPEDGRRFPEGAAAKFSGSAVDSADGALTGAAMIWTSSLDGQIGTGTSATMTRPSAGTHRITLRATDRDGLTGTDAITIYVGNTAPAVTISSPPDARRFAEGEAITFSGWAEDAEDGEIPPENLKWTSDRDGDLGTGQTVTVSSLRGVHVVTLEATDSHGSAGKKSVTVTVGAGFPTAIIISPPHNTIFEPGQTVIFRGEGEGESDGLLTGEALTWISSRDGEIGTGAYFSRSDLSDGVHEITLVTKDSAGKSGSAAVTISMGNTAPIARITSPLSGSIYAEGVAVSFEGRGQDVEDGVLPGDSLVWISSRDGEFARGNNVTTTTLSVGIHHVTLRACDVPGATGDDTITVYVGVDPNSNTAPTALITDPTSGATFREGDYIFFEGQGADTEDGVLTGDSLVWISSLSGEFGTGVSVVTNKLINGNHTITLRATDSGGATGTYSIPVTLTSNDIPTVVIQAPADQRKFELGESITFQGMATDTEDGALAAAALTWNTLVNNTVTRLGTGTTMTRNNLEKGVHVITLSAVDNQGSTGTDSITIFVGNTPPSMIQITHPQTGSVYEKANTVVFTGLAEDPEDGILSGGALQWYSNIDGLLGVGASLTTTVKDPADTDAPQASGLSQGIHTITLKATDVDGLSLSTTITITVGSAPPTAVISTPPPPAPIDPDDPDDRRFKYEYEEPVTLKGSATDANNNAITGARLVWTDKISGKTTEIGTGGSIIVNDLSRGIHVVTLTAEDAMGNKGEDSITVYVGNASPAVKITYPEDKTRYGQVASVLFSGVGEDPEDGDLSGAELTWTSSIDGELGTGASLTVNVKDPDDPASTGISQGIHIITLKGTDSAGNAGTAAITVTVGGEPPAVSITDPAPGDSLYTDKRAYKIEVDEPLELRGRATNVTGDAITGESLVWTARLGNGRAGEIGRGEAVIANALAKGIQVITLTATDNIGNVNEDAITVYVGNAAPNVSITNPPKGSRYDLAQTVVFTALVEDPEEGVLSNGGGAAPLEWTSSIDGAFRDFLSPTAPNPDNKPVLVTEGPSSVTVRGLSEGGHKITLRATDGEGLSATDEILITVVNTPPSVQITNPANNAAYPANVEYIVFSGTAEDFEDGSLSGDLLEWTSSIDGHIGTGSLVITGNPPDPGDPNAALYTGTVLSRGKHIITLTAKDQGGGAGTDEIIVYIGNTKPLVTILKPRATDTFTRGDVITCSGTGYDEEDGLLSGTSLLWRVDNIFVGSGATIYVDTSALAVTDINLAQNYKISLTAVDSGGTVSDPPAEVIITVQPPVTIP